ncbi:MAG: hypothetical protein WCK02_14960 [Bacteroidota bacterium]
MPINTTPGVYVNEISAFPNSFIGIDVSILAFIGYTAICTSKMHNKTIEINEPISLMIELFHN